MIRKKMYFFLAFAFIVSCKSDLVDQFYKAKGAFQDAYLENKETYIKSSKKITEWTVMVNETLNQKEPATEKEVKIATRLGEFIARDRMYFIETNNLYDKKIPEADLRFAVNDYKNATKRMKEIKSLMIKNIQAGDNLIKQVEK